MKHFLLFLFFFFFMLTPLHGTEHPQTIRCRILQGKVLQFLDPYLDPDWNRSLATSQVCITFKHLEAVLRGTRAIISIPLVSANQPEEEEIPNLLTLIQEYHFNNRPFVFTLFYNGTTFFILTDEENSYPYTECVQLGRYVLHPSDILNTPFLQRIPPGTIFVPVLFPSIVLCPVLVPLHHYYERLPNDQWPIDTPINSATLSLSPPENHFEYQEVNTEVSRSYAAIAAAPAVFPPNHTILSHSHEPAPLARQPRALSKPPQRPTPQNKEVFRFTPEQMPSSVEKQSRTQKRKESQHKKIEQDCASRSTPPGEYCGPVIATPQFGPRHPARILKKSPEQSATEAIVKVALNKGRHEAEIFLNEDTRKKAFDLFYRDNNPEAALNEYAQLHLKELLSASFEDCITVIRILLAVSPEQRLTHQEIEKIVRKCAKNFFHSSLIMAKEQQKQTLCRFLIEDPQDKQFWDYVEYGAAHKDKECEYLLFLKEIERARENSSICKTQPCPHNNIHLIQPREAVRSFNGFSFIITHHLTPCSSKNIGQEKSEILVETLLRMAERKHFFPEEKIKALRILQSSLTPKNIEPAKFYTPFSTPLENIIAASKCFNQLVLDEQSTKYKTTAYLIYAERQIKAKSQSQEPLSEAEHVMLLHVTIQLQQAFYLYENDIAFLESFIANEEYDETKKAMQGLACSTLAFHYTKMALLGHDFEEKLTAALERGIKLRDYKCISVQLIRKRFAPSCKPLP